jgi:hypothetical protein
MEDETGMLQEHWVGTHMDNHIELDKQDSVGTKVKSKVGGERTEKGKAHISARHLMRRNLRVLTWIIWIVGIIRVHTRILQSKLY